MRWRAIRMSLRRREVGGAWIVELLLGSPMDLRSSPFRLAYRKAPIAGHVATDSDSAAGDPSYLTDALHCAITWG
jgi:hypothetical protein